MKLSFATLLAATQLVLAAPGFVSLDVEKRAVPKNQTKTALFERDAVPESLSNTVMQYIASFSLGTPGQPQQAAIDTGSSDLWVIDSSIGQSSNVYTPSNSQTAKELDSQMNIGYVDGSGAEGNYYTDKISWGSADITVQFADATQNSAGLPQGIFGIAPVSRESVEGGGSYPNFPVALKNAGVVESTAYSLYLDDVNSSSGKILFGGVDKSKYTGTLYQFPFEDPQEFSVKLELNGHQFTGILDSGTSLTYLPSDIVESIASKYGARYNEQVGTYTVDSIPENVEPLTYNFQGAEVSVPGSELFINFQGANMLTLLPNSQTDGINLIGDSTLRSAYVVYDLDNGNVAIAQANWNGGDSDIEAISSNIPYAQPAPGF